MAKKDFYYKLKGDLTFTVNTLAGLCGLPLGDIMDCAEENKNLAVSEWELGVAPENIPTIVDCRNYAALIKTSSTTRAILDRYAVVLPFIIKKGMSPIVPGFWQDVFRASGGTKGFITIDPPTLDMENLTVATAIAWYIDFLGLNLYGSNTAWVGMVSLNKLLYDAGLGFCVFTTKAQAETAYRLIHKQPTTPKCSEFLTMCVQPMPAKYKE